MNARSVRRILVAMDASPHSHAALEEAAALAERLQAELAGVFVLDADLLRLAALPVGRETGLTSARRRALDPGSMERALRRQAEQARKALDEIAARHQLTSSFQLSSGNVAAELLEAARQADLIAMGVVGHAGLGRRGLGSTARNLRARSACSMLLLTPGLSGVSRDGSVVVVFCGSADSLEALELGFEVAARRDAELTILLCGDEDARPGLEAQVSGRLEASHLSAEVGLIAPGGFEQLKTLVRERPVGLLLIGHDCPLLAGRDDELGTLGCPVLLTRPGDAVDQPVGQGVR